MKTAVVILNWNTKEFLEQFLPTLITSTERPDTCIIVADNASTDGSLEMMAEKFPSVRTFPLDRNYGFTGGYNQVLEQVEAEYYVLLNSDVEVGPGWLDPLETWMDEHPYCGACGPKLLSFKDRESFEYAGAAGGYIDRYGYPFCRGRVLNRVERDKGQYNRPKDVLWVSGACLMVRSSVFHHLSGLDDRFFAHMEEIDLCWRMQLDGYRVTVVPESKVYHVGGGTLPNGSPWKIHLNYRNNLLLLQGNLAKTIALEIYRKSGATQSHDHEFRHKARYKSARRGYRKANRIIFRRKLFDGLSACLYLCTGRWQYFKAVIKAHREFSSLGWRWSQKQIAGFLKHHSDAHVTGRYDGCILTKALFGKEKVFNLIRSL